MAAVEIGLDAELVEVADGLAEVDPSQGRVVRQDRVERFLLLQAEDDVDRIQGLHWRNVQDISSICFNDQKMVTGHFSKFRDLKHRKSENRTHYNALPRYVTLLIRYAFFKGLLYY